MDKHYIRTDANGIVIHGFTDAFEQPQPGDLLLSGEDGRHFQTPLTNERGQYKLKVAGGQMVGRTQQELDVEWSARPAPPPSDIDELKSRQADILIAMVMNNLM